MEAATHESGRESAYEPKIVAFCCNWCSYAGADLAGTTRLQYPPNVRIIRVMCSGRVDPAFVLKAFALGADGVIVAGCHPADCHYISGNEKTAIRGDFLNSFLEEAGIESCRFKVEWIAGSEGRKFADTVKKMVSELEKLGPIGQEAPPDE
ncbi:MAG: hydrogenase iron-sulfur subunit [Candidatus Thermoplasmatota archaeon]|nr:hydrogenase iron-sulfur subunit [Candidatus Thermoplasmatota archaeon]